MLKFRLISNQYVWTSGEFMMAYQQNCGHIHRLNEKVKTNIKISSQVQVV